MLKEKIKNWLGITRIETQISQLQADIYDNDAMLNGFAVPKIMYKKTILFNGKQKKVN